MSHDVDVKREFLSNYLKVTIWVVDKNTIIIFTILIVQCPQKRKKRTISMTSNLDYDEMLITGNIGKTIFQKIDRDVFANFSVINVKIFAHTEKIHFLFEKYKFDFQSCTNLGRFFRVLGANVFTSIFDFYSVHVRRCRVYTKSLLMEFSAKNDTNRTFCDYRSCSQVRMHSAPTGITIFDYL